MTTKKTASTVMLATGLATATLAAGLALPVSTAAAAPAATASVTSTVSVKAMRVASAQALQPWPVLRQGPNSAWPRVTVRSLQYLLNARGAKLTVDGIFGAKTKSAVVTFQRAPHSGRRRDRCEDLGRAYRHGQARQHRVRCSRRPGPGQLPQPQERALTERGRHLRPEDPVLGPRVPAG